MADRMIHQRVWKVSKELDKLALLCEQHKLQVGHRDGLPDWERPRTPAGVSSARKERVPAFFAWDSDEPQRAERQQPEQEPAVQRTPTREQQRAAAVDSAATPERVIYASPRRREAAEVMPLPMAIDEGREEATAIVVDAQDDDPPEEVYSDDSNPDTREEQVARELPFTTDPEPSRLTPQRVVEASQSPYRAPSSPRYRHGRRLYPSNAAMPSSRGRSLAAGVSTVAADRYRMNKLSGKRFRSPAKRTSLWEDMCDSYIHQTNSSSTRNDIRFAKKRPNRSAAYDRNNSSSVYRTLNMDTYTWPQHGSTRGERQRIVTGPAAMDVANRAVRDFLDDHEETKSSEPVRSERQVQDQPRDVDHTRPSPAIDCPETISATPSPALTRPVSNNFRKRKTVSFGDENRIQPSTRGDISQRVNGNEYLAPVPSPHMMLADKTTQTDDELLATHACPGRPSNQNVLDREHHRDSLVRCSACETVLGDTGRPRKIHRRSANAPSRAQSSSNYHLTNPILLNPRYPPEPTTFRGRSSYSTVFDDRSSRR